MSIECFVQDAFELIRRDRFESAMALACAALDATAKSEFSGQVQVGERWEAFVKSNLDIITVVGFSGAIHAAPGGILRVLDPERPDDVAPIEKIIYKSIRCNLMHEASLPGGARFTPERFYGIRDGTFYIPVSFIYALLLAVVGAKSNASRRIDVQIELNPARLKINELWGKSELVRSKLGVLSSITVSYDYDSGNVADEMIHGVPRRPRKP